MFFHNHLDFKLRFINHLDYKSIYFDVIPSHQYFQDILQIIYQLTFFYTYSFYNLNILQHHVIYHIYINNC